MAPRLEWYVLYILKIQKRKIKLCTSVIEWKENKNKKFDLSLDIVMDKLRYYEKNKKSKKTREFIVSFYELKIILGISTPEIFDNTPYYIDYNSVISIPEGKFATCLIRERKNPVHVAGDLQIDISLLKADEIDEKNLKKQFILAVIELNEEVELYD